MEDELSDEFKPIIDHVVDRGKSSAAIYLATKSYGALTAISTTTT
jgi:hypothetical protein